MLVIRLWNYFRGYVIIKVEGLMLEKLINDAINNNIYLWDIERVDYTTLVARVGLNGFKRLIQSIERFGCRVNVVKEKGLPFFVSRLKNRKMMVVGFIAFFCIIFFLTSFIWTVEVIGEDKNINDKVIAYLKKYDIKPGIKKSNIDIKMIKDQLIYDINDISYTRAEIIGTKLIIEVKKRDIKNPDIKSNVPCNIVADKKAIIQKVIAKNGKALVKNGDIVKKGQILISGKIEDERLEEPLLVHSNGEVMGKTNYTNIMKEPIEKIIKEETGKSHVVRELKLGSKSISVAEGSIPFKYYVEKVNRNALIDNSIISLPFELVTHKYCEVTHKSIKQDVDSLKEILRVRGIKDLMDKIPKDAKVVSKHVSYKIDDKYITAIIHVEVIEHIGIKKIIEH